MKCSFCLKEVDNLGELEFEAGNNAEISVSIKACDKCYEEDSENSSAFQSKHSRIIERYASEKWADAIDYYSATGE